jgi:hypothetical protein
MVSMLQREESFRATYGDRGEAERGLPLIACSQSGSRSVVPERLLEIASLGSVTVSIVELIAGNVDVFGYCIFGSRKWSGDESRLSL